MAHIIIDRRLNSKGKSTTNRGRFVGRVKGSVREAVKKVITDGNIKDIVDSKGKGISIPSKGLSQPTFHHGKGGTSNSSHPGNKEYVQGDRIKRPPEGGGKGGSEGSQDGEGEDDFHFHLTQDEFLEIFFEDLELPDLVRKDLAVTEEFESKRCGFSTDGNPSRLNIIRSAKQAKGRRAALRGPKKKKLKELQAELVELKDILILYVKKEDGWETVNQEEVNDRIEVVEHEIVVLKRKIGAIPFMDDMDLRYNRWERFPVPTTQAVMFCIMDVSGSMGEWEKEMSKRFFMLLYLFLMRAYERVEIVFIRHHSSAKEVEEEEFFYSPETGGTQVSPAFDVMDKIVKERFPTNQWNVFACQASDGDNWRPDNPVVHQMLTETILPMCQYYAYVEIDRYGRESDLWSMYEGIKASNPNFDMTEITDVSDIYPVFRKLFEKREMRAL